MEINFPSDYHDDQINKYILIKNYVEIPINKKIIIILKFQ
jgi:hypothetical protein